MNQITNCCNLCSYRGNEWAKTGIVGCCKKDCPCHLPTKEEKCCEGEYIENVGKSHTYECVFGPRKETKEFSGMALNQIEEHDHSTPPYTWEEQITEYWNSDAPDDSPLLNIISVFREALTSQKQSILDAIEGMKKPKTEPTGFVDDEADRQIYNAALDAIKSKIQKEI